MCILVIKHEEKHTLVELSQSGAYKVHKSTVVNETGLGVARQEVYNLTRTGEEFYRLTTEACERLLENGLDSEFFEQELVSISRPFSTFMLISTLNGVILKTGTYEQINEEAAKQPLQSVLRIELALSWGE